MSQKTKGIYKIFSNTYFYLFVQKIMSATSFRGKVIKKIINKKNVKVLDIGCGPAEILEYLPKIKYFGYDINNDYISYAKKKFGDKGQFYCKKFTVNELKKIPKFDYVILFGLLHHLEEIEIKKLLINIKKALKKNGKLITLDNVFIENQNLIAKFLIKMDRGQNVRTKKEYIRILYKSFKKIKSQIIHQTFIPYTWFVTICNK